MPESDQTPVAPTWGPHAYAELLRPPTVRRAAFVVPETDLAAVLAALAQRPDVEGAVCLPSPPSTALFPGPKVSVHPTQQFSRLHGLLSARGPVDLLVERASADASDWLLRRLFFHVRAGGRYLVVHRAGAADPAAGQADGEVIRTVAGLFAMRVSGADGRADDRALAEAMAAVDIDPSRTVLVRGGESQVKLRHTEVNFVVRHSGGPIWTRVRSTTPSRTVDTSQVIGTHNNAEKRDWLYPRELEVPRLAVREYDDVVAHPYGILQKDHLILPDTFRLWLSARQRNNRLRDLSHYFAQVPPVVDEPRRLPGQYYYLDLEYRYHFGHFLADAVGRLWAWPAVKAANPDLKMLVGATLPFQVDLLAAAGVAREDIVAVNAPVAVESVVAAMPGYVIGRYVSPEVTDIYRVIQAGLPAVPSPGGELVFLTREPGLWRECTNGAALEALFVERGFTLHRPEQYSLAQQAALFREARVVAGYIGSSLFGAMFAPDPLQVVGFLNPSYTSNNEFLMASALGHTLHPFWGVEEDPPRRQTDVQGRPIGKAHRDYAFDFAASGDALVALLDQLTGSAGPVGSTPAAEPGPTPLRPGWWRRGRQA